jgi:hypothetical protein
MYVSSSVPQAWSLPCWQSCAVRIWGEQYVQYLEINLKYTHKYMLENWARRVKKKQQKGESHARHVRPSMQLLDRQDHQPTWREVHSPLGSRL